MRHLARVEQWAGVPSLRAVLALTLVSAQRGLPKWAWWTQVWPVHPRIGLAGVELHVIVA
eukprot:352983-Chlamydomonas_euryale.AAC.6